MLTVITTNSSKIDLSLYLDNLLYKRTEENSIKTVFIDEGKSRLLFPLEKPFAGKLVFIKNIECNLHPCQQRELISKLLKIKDTEIIITTFSPIIISECPRENVKVLFLEDELIKEYTPEIALGLSTNEVLDNIMSSGHEELSISGKILRKFKEAYLKIDVDDFMEALRLINDIENEIGGSTIETIRLRSIINWLD